MILLGFENMGALRFMILFLIWFLGFFVCLFIKKISWLIGLFAGEEHEVHVLGKKKWMFLQKKKMKSKKKN